MCCVEIWGEVPVADILPLVKLQKFTIHLLMSATYRAHWPTFQEVIDSTSNKIYEYAATLLMSGTCVHW